MYHFFTVVFLQPLYNGLIFLMSLVPNADAGVTIIIFTVIVRIVLYPLSRKSIETQFKMKQVEPEAARIKSAVKDKTEQATKIMELYRRNGLNPLSGFFLLLLQIPIIIALYQVFLRSGLPVLNTDLLYSFTPTPAAVNMHFLGILDISQKSYILAFLAAASQFFQMKLALPPAKPAARGSSPTDAFARSMNVQMRYLFPIMAFFIVYNLSGTIGLYWTTNNIFAILQEWYVRRKLGVGQQPVVVQTK